jgi:hypothetical protein
MTCVAVALPSAVISPLLPYSDFQCPLATAAIFAPRSNVSPPGCPAAMIRESATTWHFMQTGAHAAGFLTTSFSPAATAAW